MAATDARPFPLKGVAYRTYFPIFDNDGDLVAGAAGLDSEISKDGGTAVDCTNEATQIATSTGMYYLDLTAAEMDADCVIIIVKTSTTDAKSTPIVLFPQEADDIKVSLTHWKGTAPNDLQSGRVDSYVGAVADGVLTAAKFAAGAFDAVWSVTARLLTAGTNIVLAKGTGVTGFNDVSAAQVNAEVVDALSTDTYAEPGAVPAATASLAAKVGWLFFLARNKLIQTSVGITARDDADTVDIAAASITPGESTTIRGKFTSP